MSATRFEPSTAMEFVNYLTGYFTSSARARAILLFGPIGAFVAGAMVSVVDLKMGVAAIALLVIIVMTWLHPPLAGYAMVSAAPAIVGLERYQVIPVLRPNEALLFVLIAVLTIRWMVYSRKVEIRLHRMDFAMIALVLAGFALPLLTQFARLRPVSPDDILYALVFVRLGLLYGLVRYTIRTRGQVRAAIGFSLAVASILGIVGLADSLNILNTAERLNPYFPNAGPIADDGRGAASIGNPIGFGVYVGINACLALAMLLGGERPRPVLAIAAICCTIGVFGSGQIGPSISFAVGLVALAVMTRSVTQLLRWSVPMVLVASIVITPLAIERVNGFGGFEVTSANRQAIADTGGQEESRALFAANPGSSWDVRLYNLETFFIPRFSEPANVYFGVTPQARVPSPNEGEDFIWIESGHLWLIWSGGLPLFFAFFAFIGVGMYVGFRATRRTPGPVGIAGAALFAALTMLFVAQTFDPHLTLRGTSDILYPLAALAVCGEGVRGQRFERSVDRWTPTESVEAARRVEPARSVEGKRLVEEKRCEAAGGHRPVRGTYE